MAKSKPISEQLIAFLKGNLGGRYALAPLTGTDYRCLIASNQIIEAYSVDRHPDYLIAFGLIVRRMQRQCWYFAYHGIARALDWSDRMDVWMAAGLPTEALEHAPLCEMEPKGPGRQRHSASADLRETLHAIDHTIDG